MRIDFTKIKVGNLYDRIALAKMWGYKAHQAISRGVITPVGTSVIILFVTKEKQASSTQYVDYINEDYLYWEGEEKGGNNERIIKSRANGDTVYLFFRHKHHELFIYMGVITLENYIPNKNGPFEFVFKLQSEHLESQDQNQIREPIYELENKATEKVSITLSRIGQGAFRVNLFKLWQSCSVTNANIPEILRASHIKPWKNSNNTERLNPYNGLLLTPTFDSLFDKGFISFEDDGFIILSKKLSPHWPILQISPETRLRTVFEGNVDFLKYHRDYLFIK